MSINIVDRAGFEEVVGSGRPVVVDFYADWCRPCHALAPELERIATSFSDHLTVVKVDVDAEPEIAQTFGVMSIPTVLHLGPTGDEVARSTGAVPAAELVRRLDLAAYKAATA